LFTPFSSQGGRTCIIIPDHSNVRVCDHFVLPGL
jgi:hypothetical protein